MEINVSLSIFFIGFLTFGSWFTFALFGGIGLSALPMDLIYMFTTRPKDMPKEAIDKLKESVILRAHQLKSLAMNIKQMEEDFPNIHKANCMIYK